MHPSVSDGLYILTIRWKDEIKNKKHKFHKVWDVKKSNMLVLWDKDRGFTVMMTTTSSSTKMWKKLLITFKLDLLTCKML